MRSINSRARILALIIALVMAAGTMAGCQATINNPVVAKVGDVDITYSDFYTQFNNYATYLSYGYMAVEEGMDEDEQLREWTFETLINNAIPIAIAHSEGITLDEDELAEVDVAVQSAIDNYLEQYASYVDPEITDEAAIRDAEMEVLLEALKAADMTYDEMEADIREQAIDNAKAQKLEEQAVAGADVSEEEITAWYENTLAEQQAAYEADPYAYYTAMQSYTNSGGVRPLVAPDGYFYFKHILILNPAEGETKDVDLIVTEVLKRIADGDDFDALITEYGEDPGMTYESNANGYILGEANASAYYAEFSAAALELANIGDVSGPVTSSAGVHIIKKVGKVDTTPVPLADVHDEIYDYLLAEEQKELLSGAMEQWREALNIKRYDNRVKYFTAQQ